MARKIKPHILNKWIRKDWESAGAVSRSVYFISGELPNSDKRTYTKCKMFVVFFIHYLDLADFLSLCTKLFFKKLIDSEFMTGIHSNEKSVLRNKMERKKYIILNIGQNFNPPCLALNSPFVLRIISTPRIPRIKVLALSGRLLNFLKQFSLGPYSIEYKKSSRARGYWRGNEILFSVRTF